MKKYFTLIVDLLFWGLAFAALWPCVESIREALGLIGAFPLTNDEAHHAELIEVISQTGKYRDWAGTPFVLSLTTGPTLILPAALLSWSSGIPSALAGRAVTLSYFLGLIVLLSIWLKSVTSTKWLPICAGLGVFFLGWRSNSEMQYFSYGILGDGIGLFYIAASLFLIERRNYLGGGICASLAALSKPYFVVFAAVLFFYSWAEFLRRNQKVPLVRLPIDLSLGLAIPLLGWIGLMIFQEGFQTAWTLCISYPSLFSSRAMNPPLLTFQETLNRISNLGILFKSRALLIGVVGCFLALPKRLGRSNRILGIFAVVHFCWWLFLSDGYQMRYVVPVFFVGWLSCALHGARILSQVRFLQRPDSPKLEGSLAAVLIVWLVLSEYRHPRESISPFTAQIQMQRFWKNLSRSNSLIWSTHPLAGEIDKEVLLSAPHRVEKFQMNSLRQHQTHLPSNSRVVYTVYSEKGTLDLLLQRGCTALFSVTPEKLGFYQCP